MEAPETHLKTESTQKMASEMDIPQPQREKRTPRNRNDKNVKPKTYYKTDVVSPEEVKESKEPIKEPEKEITEQSATQEKYQARQNLKQPVNRPEKVYQPKKNGTTNSVNEPVGQSVHDNGKVPRRNYQKGKQQEGGNKKESKKQQETEEVQEKIGNERFDNSSDVKEVTKDPHKALQVAEASRLQEIIPSGVHVEVQEKVKRIQEIVGKDVEFYVIYGALEDLGYDEEKTVSYFLEKKSQIAKEVKQEKQDPKASVQPGTRWTNIVKKGIRTYGYYDETALENGFREPEERPKNNSGRFRNKSALPNGPVTMDAEELVTNLSVAIAAQLQQIQEQTKLLTVMQNELATITKNGKTERENLLAEKQQMKRQESELLAELDSVHERITEIDLLLEENQKKKAERISNITSNNLVASLLKKPGPPMGAPTNTQQYPANTQQYPTNVQQSSRSSQQQNRSHQKDYKPRNYNNAHNKD